MDFTRIDPQTIMWATTKSSFSGSRWGGGDRGGD